uniref:Uncharacterized protein n=1 Tax=Anguilla anguilla TaxID=7936 RepID=A0A0E9WDD9_ANGAN
MNGGFWPDWRWFVVVTLVTRPQRSHRRKRSRSFEDDDRVTCSITVDTC